jgi:hypothetical protein
VDFQVVIGPQGRKLRTIEFEGTLEFAGGNVTTRFTSRRVISHIVVPAACLGGLSGAACTQAFEGADCDPAAAGCDCTGVEDDGPSESSEPYEIVGNTVVTAGQDVAEYCIQGDTLRVKLVDEDVEDATTTTILWNLDRVQ